MNFYTGNPIAVQPPSPAPGPAVAPVVGLPQDGIDDINSATFSHAPKVLADLGAYLTKASSPWLPILPTSSGFSAVTHSGVGTGTVTPSGAGLNLGRYFAIKIIAGGAVGTATFQTSIDGGGNYGATQTTAASMTDATGGETLAFAGTFTLGDVYFFQSAVTPQAQWHDTAGNVRFLVDHNGYPLGRLSQFRFEWLQLADPKINAAPAYSLNNPTSAYPAPFGSFAGGTAIGTNYFAFGTQSIIHGGANFVSLVFEAEIAYSTITATNTTLGVGLTDSFSVAAPTNAIMFQRPSGGTNWKGVMTGSTTIDLGTPPVVASVPSQRLRLEIHGSASPFGSGGNGVALFFINEALVGMIVGVVPNSFLLPAFGITTGGSAPSAGTTPLIGPFRIVWNRALSLPAL